jgi:hypothetical protein
VFTPDAATALSLENAYKLHIASSDSVLIAQSNGILSDDGDGGACVSPTLWTDPGCPANVPKPWWRLVLVVPTVELVVGSIDIELLNGYRTAFVSGPESGGCSVVNAVNGSLDIQTVDPTSMTFELAINDTLSLPNVVAVDNFYATPCSEGTTTGGGSGVGGGATGGSGGGSSTGSSGSGGSTGNSMPLQHRVSDAQCSAARAPATSTGPGPLPGGCTIDSDCTNGTNGRCAVFGGGPAADCQCSYDTCEHDTDCPSNQTCACHGAPYTDGAGNTCVQGNCRVDADCGLTAQCGDSLAGYYCHTARDLCVDDGDCPRAAGVVGNPTCLYSTRDARWECDQVIFCL